MNWSSPTLEPQAGQAVAHVHVPAADRCMFCDDSLDLASTGEDPLAFKDHLALSATCSLEYQMWRQVIRDEWSGD